MEAERKIIEDSVEKSEESSEENSDEKDAEKAEQQNAKIAAALKQLSERYEHANLELLETWYKRDSNVRPPVYRLQRIR